eukprot:TRINITY_DN2368_c0_g1_i1.p1 TRINITY_DN2368_c0_g1~~TRINITY_DN2368_c0_g1_i1.p1  ORF type:complete len:837 (-),score=190.27 TRINITY_DN2368_c0_g1_i1:57-2567(-)
MSNFQQLLHDTLLRSTGEQSQVATSQFEAWEQENANAFFYELATYLGDESKPDQTRFMAGMLLKNSLTSEDSKVNALREERWKGMPAEVKVHIRKHAYNSMGSSQVSTSKAAVQVIGRIGVLDINSEWPDLMQMLMSISIGDASDQQKLACIDAMGFIFEDGEGLEKFSDHLLTSAIHNLNSPNPKLVISALKALSHGLEFCAENIQKTSERDIIIKNIINACQNPNEEISETAFGLLHEIISEYYDHIQDQMTSLFKVTLDAIQNADEDIAKYAIEFWNTVCEIEIERNTEGSHSYHFAKAALGDMVPVLCKTLTKQDDPEYDSNDYTLPIAASVSLKFFAQCVQADIINLLMPFVEQNIKSSDWILQDAALLSLIAILEVQSSSITQIVSTAVPILLNLLQNSSVIAIRDNSAWTLGQIFKVHPNASFPFATDVFNYMGNALQNESPRIAAHACFTIHSMAESFGCHPESPVMKYYGMLIETLLKTGDRLDSVDYNLRSSAYETMMLLLLLAPEGCDSIFFQLLEEVVVRLEKTITPTENHALGEAAELCCGVVQVIASHLREDILPYSERIITALLALLGSANGKQVSHDAFLAITAIEQAIYEEFKKFVPQTMKFIINGLKNWEDANACTSATDLLSDIVNILENEVSNYSDEVMDILLNNMKLDIGRNVKTSTIRCFGDIAMSLGSQFSRYSYPVLEVLHETTEVIVGLDLDELDFEDQDYVDSLRVSLFDTYATIVTSASQKEKDLLQESCANLLKLVYLTAKQEYLAPDLVCATWGVLGDLISLFKQNIKELVHPELQQLAYEATKNSDSEIESEVATRALDAMRSIRL